MHVSIVFSNRTEGVIDRAGFESVSRLLQRNEPQNTLMRSCVCCRATRLALAELVAELSLEGLQRIPVDAWPNDALPVALEVFLSGHVPLHGVGSHMSLQLRTLREGMRHSVEQGEEMYW